MSCVITLQDAVEPSKEASQDNTQAGFAEQSRTTANGNGSGIGLHAATQPRQQLPVYPFFNAHSSRVYPEWSVPEPVALPRRANGFWGASWSQPQDASATQAAAADAQASPEPVQVQSPAVGISDTQTTPGLLQTGPFQPAQTSDLPPTTTQPEAEQRQAIHNVPAQQVPPHGLVSEQPHDPTTARVSMTQPPSSAALLHPTPASAQPPLPDTPLHIVATQNAVPAVEHRSANGLPQPVSSQHQQPPSQPQVAQQHSEAMQCWPQQQEQQEQQQQQAPPQQPSQQLLEQVPGAADQAPADTEAMSQQLGPGATDEAAATTAAPNVGAYSQRELFLQNLEQAGDMSFEYVLNDGQRHNSIWSVILLGTTRNM